MSIFAVLSGNTVSNFVVAETLSDAELATGSTCIEYPEDSFVGMGWTYVDGTFIAPQLEEVTDV